MFRYTSNFKNHGYEDVQWRQIYPSVVTDGQVCDPVYTGVRFIWGPERPRLPAAEKISAPTPEGEHRWRLGLCSITREDKGDWRSRFGRANAQWSPERNRTNRLSCRSAFFYHVPVSVHENKGHCSAETLDLARMQKDDRTDCSPLSCTALGSCPNAVCRG